MVLSIGKYLKINSVDFFQWFFLLGIILGRYVEALFIFLICLVLILKHQKIVLPRFVMLFIVIFLSSLILIYINSYSYLKFIQQFIFIFIVFFSYVQYLELTKPDINIIFNKYILIMYFICILGLLQFIICFFTMIDIFPFSLDGYIQRPPSGRIMRIHSILNEAGNLGTCLTPIIAYILFDKKFFKENRGKSIIIIITHLLTFATVSYVLLALLLFVKMYMKVRHLKYILIVGAIAIIPFFIGFLNASVDNIEKDNLNGGFFSMMRQKIIETSIFFELKDPQAFETLNTSSYATLTNLWVATNAPCRLTGTGLGTHQENYERLYTNDEYPFYGLNSEDGYSLFIRVLSEFGIIGIIFYYIFIIRNFNSQNIINFCIFFLLVALWVRGGHYTFYGTVFFHLIYYYTSRNRGSAELNEL